MPWTVDDVDKHKKGLSDAKKKTWVKVANKALRACLDKGGEQDECEASAIKQANAVVGNMNEAETLVQIAQSAIETARALVNDSKMLAAVAEAKGVSSRQVANGMLDELEAELAEAKTKTVNGKPRPASDFLVVEDSDKPSTWHLPVKVNGKPDHRLMGAAWAALHKGYRGNKYEGPNKQEAIRKLKALYKSEDMETPAAESKIETSTVNYNLAVYSQDAGRLRDLLQEALDLLGSDRQDELGETDLCESASGTVLELAESTEPADPLKLHVAVIEPGFGNEKDNHYYSRSMLERDAGVFDGVKMYATNHRPDERSVRTEVSQILKCPVGFTESGAPIALVGVYDNDFADNIRNRAALDTLNSLHCSILARGSVKPGKVNGRKAKIVESIMSAQSVDWVTQAGAGGHALNLAESAGGGDMSDKDMVKETEEETKEEILTESEPEMLAEGEVKRLLSESNLPTASRERLAEAEYADEDAVGAAIVAEVAYVKRLTGSGKPFGQGSGGVSQGQRISEADIQTALDDIDRRHGLYVREAE